MPRLATALDLKPHLAHCDNCTLAGCPIVPGNGPHDAALVVVGEAPGATEVARGRGFVGRSGQRLDAVFKEAGIDRKLVAFTNATVCWPHERDADGEARNRTPTKAEVEACNERLIAEVMGYNPRVVVALGAVAWNALTVKAPSSGSRRGILQPWAPPVWVDGVKKKLPVRLRQPGPVTETMILPTWHPAYVLRYPDRNGELVRDLTTVQAYLDGDLTPGEEEVRYVEVSDPAELRRLLTGHYATEGILSLDIETGGDGALLCIGLLPVDRQDLPVLIATGDALRETALWSDYLRRAKPMGHNLKFDIQGLWRHGIECHVASDTLLAQYSMDESASGTREDGSDSTGVDRGLKTLAQQILCVPDWSLKVKDYLKNNRLELCPKEDMLPYNARDVLYTAQLYQHLEAQTTERSRRVVETLLIPAANVLARMEYQGIMIDRSKVTALQETLQADLEAADDELRELCAPEIGRIEADLNAKRTPRTRVPPKRFLFSSWQQVSRLLYRELNLPRPADAKGGGTDKNVLEVLKGLDVDGNPDTWRRGGAWCDKLLEFRHLSKFLGTYINKLPELADAEDRIHASFHLHRTVSGRLSASNPNLQNQPARRGKDIQRLYVASPGYTFVAADLSQAELRVTAGFSGDPNLLAAIRSGTDLHRSVAAMLFECRPEEVTDAQRSLGKNSGFAFLYGAEAAKIAQVAKITLEQAQDVLDRLHRAFPVAMAWLESVRRDVVRDGYTETPYGRRRQWSWVPPSGKERAEILRAAGNFPIQCGRKDMPVLTLNGFVPLGGLEEGNIVWTGKRWAPVAAKGVTTKPEYRMDLSIGVPLFYSPDHWFLTGAGWKQVRDLTPEDTLVWAGAFADGPGTLPSGTVTPDLFASKQNAHFRNIPSSLPDTPTSDVAWLLGFTVGDGSYTSGKGVSWAVGDADVLCHLQDVFAALGVKATASQRYWRGEPSYHDVKCGSTVLCRWLARLGLEPALAWDKTVPKWLLTAPAGHRLAFLAGLYDADGGITGTPEKGFTPMFTTTSAALAEGVSLLLSSLGTKSIVRSYRPSKGGNRHYYRVQIPPEYQDLSLPLACGAKQRLWEVVKAYNGARPRRHDHTADAAVVKILKVEPTGRDVEMVDICVNDPDHTFVTGGVVSHNSSSSDIMLGALIRIGNAIDWQRTRLLLTIHDALLVETMEEPIEVARWLVHEMTRVTPFPDVPFAAEAKIGNNWGDMHKVEV